MSVEVFLANGPLSLDDVISSIRTQSLDDKARPVFSDAEIKLALRQAIVNAYGKFFTSDTYEFSYSAGNFEYSLPMYVQRITRIYRSGSGAEASGANTLTGASAGQKVVYYSQLRNFATNTLYFSRDYPTSMMTVWYERDVTIPIDNRVVAADHTADETTLTLEDSEPLLYQVALPAYFRWDNEIIKMTAVSGNTSATIVRGQLGTTAAVHSTASEISQLILADSDRFYNFLFQETGRLLNEFRVQAGSQTVNVAANITAARMFKDNREMILKEIPQTKRSRQLKLTRSRRPRRGLY